MKKRNNNSAFGMTVQKLICEEYNLETNEWAENQYDANYDSQYDGVRLLFPDIFNEIGANPVKCLSFERTSEFEDNSNPHNFLLSNGMTLSVKTTKSKKRGKVAPQIIGQAGYEKLNIHFNHLVENKIENPKDIKDLVWNNVEKVIPIFIDYLFLSDILLWIFMDNGQYGYKLIYRGEKPDMLWEKESFSFTKSKIEDWNESISIKYENVSIAEVQVHKKRTFKFRFILDILEGFFKKKEINNETVGISIENAICKMYNLERPDHLEKRSDKSIEKDAKNVIKDAFKNMPKPIEYVGNKTGARGGRSKSPVDFLLEYNNDLSLKTNIKGKVCPPEIGQPSIETFKNHFAYLIENLDEFDSSSFKKLAINSTDKLMNEYLKYLLDCDYLLWIYKNGKKFKYKILTKDLNFVFKAGKFKFTRDEKNWNESTTVKYDGITIGEFQVHKGRNSLKFRFDMKNLIELLEKEK